jgi:predicted nucleic acid-binding protein
MPEIKLFLDSSALFAGIISADGGGRALLLLGEAGKVRLTISEQVVVDTERAIARKLPRALPEVRLAILRCQARIMQDPDADAVLAHLDWMNDPADVPILLAAMQAKVDYLVMLHRKHFLEDPRLPQRAGLGIGTPGDALAWLRSQITPFRY